jgi:hypothetical protein
MFYQLLMIGLLAFVFTKAGIKIVHGNWQPLLYILFGLFFSLSLLIVIHELIHGLALKLVGVPKVSYGGYIRKFIFYAEADLFVLNKRQFVFVALAPLVFVKVITLAGIIVCFYDPVVSLFALVMGIHSFFCSGDIGLLSVFVRKDKAEVFTFDVKEIRKSYFYRRKIDD